MTLIQNAGGLSPVEQIGWLLVHSLWQFGIGALVAVAVQRIFKRSSANTRYLGLLGVLTLAVMTPAATWFVLPALVSVAMTPVPGAASPSAESAIHDANLRAEAEPFGTRVPAADRAEPAHPTDSRGESSALQGSFSDAWWVKVREVRSSFRRRIKSSSHSTPAAFCSAVSLNGRMTKDGDFRDTSI